MSEGRKLKTVYVAKGRVALQKTTGKYCSAGRSIACNQSFKNADNFKWKCIEGCSGKEEQLDTAHTFDYAVSNRIRKYAQNLVQLGTEDTSPEIAADDNGWF